MLPNFILPKKEYKKKYDIAMTEQEPSFPFHRISHLNGCWQDYQVKSLAPIENIHEGGSFSLCIKKLYAAIKGFGKRVRGSVLISGYRE